MERGRRRGCADGGVVRTCPFLVASLLLVFFVTIPPKLILYALHTHLFVLVVLGSGFDYFCCYIFMEI